VAGRLFAVGEEFEDATPNGIAEDVEGVHVGQYITDDLYKSKAHVGPNSIIQLQHSIGNQAVLTLLRKHAAPRPRRRTATACPRLSRTPTRAGWKTSDVG
jgi:hypothetical protein